MFKIGICINTTGIIIAGALISRNLKKGNKKERYYLVSGILWLIYYTINLIMICLA